MDLSAIIFVVLALAWAVYLIPKALKHHDEMASDRLVEGHSDKVRILSRHKKAAAAAAAAEATATVVEAAPERSPEPTPTLELVAPCRDLTRAAARKAAQRRRRVLALLMMALAAVWGFTWFAYLPSWAPAVPSALVVGWLVLARLSVRRARRARRARPAMVPKTSVPTVEVATEPAFETRVEARPDTSATTEILVEQLADEDTTGIARQDLEAVLADDGSLWDPLPVTLPTYVNKARARRTVRTIELTGLNSSGHDQADSALARDAADSAHEATQAATEAASQRKAAGA